MEVKPQPVSQPPRSCSIEEVPLGSNQNSGHLHSLGGLRVLQFVVYMGWWGGGAHSSMQVCVDRVDMFVNYHCTSKAELI